MPHWEGIEDASVEATRIWLTKTEKTEKLSKGTTANTTAAAATKDEEPWKPLRKCDCQALNEVTKAKTEKKVHIEFGRATADLEGKMIRYNFCRAKNRKLCSAIWFKKELDSKSEIVLRPIENEADSEVIEKLYQDVVAASSSLGKGIKSLLSTEVPISDNSDGTKRVALLVKPTANSLKLVIQPKGWFKGQIELQRGYGQYTVPGEEEELALGPLAHLGFVVHGIGEALFSQEEVGMPSLVETVNACRTQIQRMQIQEWKEKCIKAKKDEKPEPPPPNRIELIPIEWFHKIHDSSTCLMKSLRSCSLPTIPLMRSIANDVVFDVLMYLTPEFNTHVLEAVTEQIHEYYISFMDIHGKDFHHNDGKCYLIGHSLGSVICWDLLAILKSKEVPEKPVGSKSKPTSTEVVPQWSSVGSNNPDHKCPDTPPSAGILCGAVLCDFGTVGYQAYAKEENVNDASHGTWGPSLTKPMERVLPFIPESTFFLGSPLGIFLTLRGAHAVFDQMRYDAQAREQRKRDEEKKSVLDESLACFDEKVPVPAVSPFTMPTERFYNIFHPNDPVAYRIEPLLLSPDLDPTILPPPTILTPPGRTVRFSTKARQIGDEIRKTIEKNKSTWNALIDTTVKVLGQQDEEKMDARIDKLVESLQGEGSLLEFPLNGGRRVDYALQTGVIENEYISSITAHSNYFNNDDFLGLLISLTQPKKVNPPSVETTEIVVAKK